MKKIIYVLGVGSLLLTTSCKKEFDINANPNSATESSMSARLVLPYAMHATASRLATSYGFLANWMGYWGPSGTYAPNVEESTYNITSSFQSGQWSGWYDILKDLRVAEQKANAADEDFYEGIAIMMQTFGWQALVDMYGNVPYSKAFDLTGNIAPAYDKGQDIYNDLLKRLETAITLIKSADVAKSPQLATTDIMFAGNKTMWAKLGNTLRLRLLIHQSQVPGFNPAAEIAKITAEGSGFLGAGQTAYVQPGYSLTDGKLNPFWASFEASANGTPSNDFYRANNYVLNIFKNANDLRYTRVFDPATQPASASNPYIGVTYGNPPDVNFNSVRTSNVGGPGLAISATQPQWLFTSVESLFLQAEAIARGWLPGNAQTAYENAVRESFTFLGVPNATTEANNYLAAVGVNGPSTLSNWASVAAGTVDQKVRFIVMQKYLALVGINPLEAWTDWRRLGVPTNIPTSTNPARVSATPPVRLLYPAAEFNYNNANVTAEGTINQFNSFIFWDK